ncbi:MAG: glycogen/starch/alpha-glucan phosphorylase [Tissierellia bacterium]|nr:glycogen/starch/alpha-glucan phosphorylase [Tissierellia bacterium]
MVKRRMNGYALSSFGKSLNECNIYEKNTSLAKALIEEIVPLWKESEKKFDGKKRAYYLSSEYLMGRALSNNLINHNIKNEIESMLEEMGIHYDAIEEAEEDAGLGNGGLGRLAACFLDSAATLNYPLTGYGIRYAFGIFEQKFVDGFQVEEADRWLKYGDPWSIRKEDERVKITFSDCEIYAVPYDTPIIGYKSNTINTLRLWMAEPLEVFNFEAFNNQNYDLAVKEKNNAENIGKVLYPNDSNDEGKLLRLKQQYFFVSASLQDIVRNYKKTASPFDDFAEYHAIQLNDTHPTVAIPELMRILTQEENISWDKAWEIVIKTFAYTNHTLLAEALEQWPVRLYKSLLPNIFDIIVKINNQLMEELEEKGIYNSAKYEYEIIQHDSIKMAHLAIYGSKSINGVAKIHSELIKDRELNQWYRIYPQKFSNKTNGVTQRRWLLQSNPELAGLFTELLGSDEWIVDLSRLKELEKYINDENVLKRFLDIKHRKKVQLAEYIKKHEGIEVDSNSMYDILIKRMHEYKRQLLDAFNILDLYYKLKENSDLDFVPRTFIFGAKAAPGYYRAKTIIKFINDLADLVNNDKDINGKIKVVFVENYKVSYAERLFPAADVSEQISTAGKEASGTGNMKFMINGAPTLGTYDGANIEIFQEAGEENNFVFGLRVEEIEEIKNNYNPHDYYNNVPGLRRVVDSLVDGTFDDKATGRYAELYDSLLKGANWERPDRYFVLRDFESYRNAQQKINDEYKDRINWAKKCWMNLANSGKFSSDRTLTEYATEIWDIEKEQSL